MGRVFHISRPFSQKQKSPGGRRHLVDDLKPSNLLHRKATYEEDSPIFWPQLWLLQPLCANMAKLKVICDLRSEFPI